MFKFLKKSRGQSTVEYAILIIIIIGALISIQIYIKRGIQGRFKDSADNIGEQYSTMETFMNKVTRTSSSTRETFNRGVQSSTIVGNETTNIFRNQFIMNAAGGEYWGR
ncbi:MAG TPA: hypothetical protein PL155_02590 [Candidatus Omnitrophota bacterium]|nr:hypothetical protein [Candidatus Omnitrophota bacterium]HPD84626.1 hypothetical protein [Candidatus Omnitrophota bacterium]HRZ03484.1 hypothetical protein [Candidatus Omnitrophota bacterium]